MSRVKGQCLLTSFFPFPKQGKGVDHDFQGGAGASFMDMNTISVHKKNYEDSTSSEDVDESVEKNKNDTTEVTPSRQSARTAGKKFK